MMASDWTLIRHFKPIEFKNPEKMGYEFMLWLERLRVIAGVPFVITSSYRSPEYNRSVGGASDSAHTDVPCNAVDIGMRSRKDDPNWNYTRFQIVAHAIASGCLRIGSYANGSLHLDRTEHERPSPRMWRVVGNEP
jgi:hypothetical protein